ncbi:putative DNA ligase [Cocos nucifera]|uniref:Putative DNA ligase n=1 Tax=Cocos nucifera TaxID=13894 RepID=A0A8K0HUY2_COCNU|nr:putative DNA ligase [Cocos nucifera]
MRCDRRSGVSTSPPSSRKKKFRCSAFFSFCFGGAGGPPEEVRPASLLRSSSTWLRSKAKELPELQERCRSIVSRIRGPRRRAGGFRYDPLSYALNFDEGDDSRGDSELFRYRKPPERLSV